MTYLVTATKQLEKVIKTDIIEKCFLNKYHQLQQNHKNKSRKSNSVFATDCRVLKIRQSHKTNPA